VSIDGTLPPPRVEGDSNPNASHDEVPRKVENDDSRPHVAATEYFASESNAPMNDSPETKVATADVAPENVPAEIAATESAASEVEVPNRITHTSGRISVPPPSARIGRYALFEQFATGGIATVHFGRLDGAGGFSRVVAIKRLLPHLLKNEEFTEMLLKEARLAARVRHPNVVPTLDVVASHGDVLLVLEYVHGEALSTLCRTQAKQRKDHIPLEIAIRVMHDVLSGLCAVHEATDERGRLLGLVHRDISPPNVIVGADGHSRVLDFGIAKALEHIEESMPSRLKGKIGYMSPEQIRGEGVTQRSDVFSAGIILWELLATCRLFSSSDESERMRQIVSGNYPRPSEHRPGLSSKLEQVTMRALSLDPEGRYANSREFAEALEEASERASARRVTEWVTDLAAPALAERTRMIAQVENWNPGPDIAPLSSPFATDLRFAAPSAAPQSGEVVSLTNSKLASAMPPQYPEKRKAKVALLLLASVGILLLAAYYAFGL
jgi:serine/threonine-protein kinase